MTNSGVTLKSSISERRISCISVTHRPPIWVLEFQLAIFPFWIGFGPRRELFTLRFLVWQATQTIFICVLYLYFLFPHPRLETEEHCGEVNSSMPLLLLLGALQLSQLVLAGGGQADVHLVVLCCHLLHMRVNKSLKVWLGACLPLVQLLLAFLRDLQRCFLTNS